MRHAVRDAVLVQQLLALDDRASLERALRIADAGVDPLGVARASVGADRVLGLEDYDLAPAEGEGARDREPDYARADDDGVKPLHVNRGAACARRGPPASTAGRCSAR